VGLIKQAKAETAAQDARRARDEGRNVLVYSFNFSKFSKGGAWISGLVPGAAERIEAIEAEGWRLENIFHRNEDMFVMLFRASHPHANEASG
jgi:hypothetical protein